MKVLAIDPGTKKSGYVILRMEGRELLEYGKIENERMLSVVKGYALDRDSILGIEKVMCYGQRVGIEVFETVHWAGRFHQLGIDTGIRADDVFLVPRVEVKMHLCHTANAKDAAVRIVLQDRFGPRKTKANPKAYFPAQGEGFSDDAWQAFALGITICDTFPNVPFSEY